MPPAECRIRNDPESSYAPAPHKAMSYERMEARAAELEAEVAKWLAAAEAADEPCEFGGISQQISRPAALR